ncbi:MAG: hypothetical protein QXS91_04125 [Candidatus Anstonellales archaeon]
MNLFYITLAITLLFFVLLIVKAVINKFKKFDFCVICASVSLTWLFLLVLFYLGLYGNIVLIALLMGGSVVGLFYFIERKIAKTKNKELTLFRLPFLLTLIFIAYTLLFYSYFDIRVVYLLALLWLLFFFIFLYRKNPKLKKIINKIIECCKRW